MENLMEKRRINQNIELSIIIVSYFTDDLVKHIQESFSDEKRWEIIVIRNDTQNIGFSKGCNNGAKQARGKYVFFMNPDVKMSKESIKSLMLHLKKHPETGVVGPQFVKNKQVEQTCTQIPSALSLLVSQTSLSKVSFLNKMFKNEQMIDWNRKTSKDVGAVSGAALMVRRQEFINLGGFDEKFFMYWEEIDLCKRYRENGMTVHFLVSAKAKHLGQESTKRSNSSLHNVFAKSRFYYMRKHFGFIPAILIQSVVYLFENIHVLSLIGVSTFLRSFQIFTYTSFFGDMGRDYIKAVDFITLKTFPLLGIPSSVPRLSQGPFNIWFDAISFVFSGASVFAPPLLAAIVTTIFIVYFYRYLHKEFGKSIAYVMSLLLATSPSFVLQSRSPFYLFAVPIFVFLYLFSLDKVTSVKRTSVFFASLCAFLMLQWEIATLPLILLLPITLWKKKCISMKYVSVGLLGASISLFSKILYDFTHSCEQICGVFSWALYRTIALTGFDGRHGLSIEILTQFIKNTYIQLIYLFGKPYPFALILILLLVLYALYVYFVKKVQITSVFYALFSGVLLMIGIFIHSSPSEAYFPPYLVIIPIILSFALKYIDKNIRKVLLICFVLISILQSYVLLRNHFYSQNIQDIISAARYIQNDSKGNAVHLISYDAGSEFSTYLDTYRFLLLKNGVILSQSGKSYVISNTQNEVLPTLNTKMVFFGHVTVVVKNM